LSIAILPLCLLAVLVLLTAPAMAGLHDPGMVQGKLRTEYPDGLGAGGNWLTLWYVGNGLPGAEGCLFDAQAAPAFGCPGRAGLPPLPNGNPVWKGAIQFYDACNGNPAGRIGDSWIDCISYDSSSLFELNNPGSQYWVISANEEPSFDQCQEGPPNLSHPVKNLFAAGGDQLFNVATSDVVSFYFRSKRVHLKVNHDAHDFYCSDSGKVELTQPFLAVGAQKGAGNSTDLGNLQRGSSSAVDRLRFTTRIKAYQPFNCPSGTACAQSIGPGVHVGFFVIAEWSGVPRLLFVELFRDGVIATFPAVQKSNWNWPVYDSFYWPGGQVGVISAAAARGCGLNVPDLVAGGSYQYYDIDLTALFECASLTHNAFSPSLPYGSIPIHGVHFFVESANATGGSLEMTVERVYLD
jgi:hypothetical protein